MCGTVNEAYEEENFDTIALDPDGWDYISHSICSCLGKDKKCVKKHAFEKNRDVRGNTGMWLSRCRPVSECSGRRKRTIEGWKSWVFYVMKRGIFGGRCHGI